MSKIVLEDPRTGISISHDADDEGWSLKDAVAELTNKIVEETGIPVHEIMFNNEPFRILVEEEEYNGPS